MEHHPSPHHLANNTRQEEESVEMIKDRLMPDATTEASPALVESSHTIIPAAIIPTATREGAENIEIAINKNHPAFITKVYSMLETPNLNHLIRWQETRPRTDANYSSFVVLNPNEFSSIVAPQYFKHSNWQSFVRQLNMYGFHKVNEAYAGPASTSSLPTTIPAAINWEFHHPSFQRGRPDLFRNIKRKSTRGSGAARSSCHTPRSSTFRSPGSPATLTTNSGSKQRTSPPRTIGAPTIWKASSFSSDVQLQHQRQQQQRSQMARANSGQGFGDCEGGLGRDRDDSERNNHDNRSEPTSTTGSMSNSEGLAEDEDREESLHEGESDMKKRKFDVDVDVSSFAYSPRPSIHHWNSTPVDEFQHLYQPVRPVPPTGHPPSRPQSQSQFQSQFPSQSPHPHSRPMQSQLFRQRDSTQIHSADFHHLEVEARERVAAQISGLDSRVKDMSEALDKVISETRSTREVMYDVMNAFLAAVGSGEGRHDFSNEKKRFSLTSDLPRTVESARMLLERHNPDSQIPAFRRASSPSTVSGSSRTSLSGTGGVDASMRLPPMRLDPHSPPSRPRQLHHSPVQLQHHFPLSSVTLSRRGSYSKDSNPRVRRVSSLLDQPSPASSSANAASPGSTAASSIIDSRTLNKSPYIVSIDQFQSQPRHNSLDLDKNNSRRGSTALPGVSSGRNMESFERGNRGQDDDIHHQQREREGRYTTRTADHHNRSSSHPSPHLIQLPHQHYSNAQRPRSQQHSPLLSPRHSMTSPARAAIVNLSRFPSEQTRSVSTDR